MRILALSFAFAMLLLTACGVSGQSAQSAATAESPSLHSASPHSASQPKRPSLSTSCRVGWEDGYGVWHAGQGDQYAPNYNGPYARVAFTNHGPRPVIVGSYTVAYLDASGTDIGDESYAGGGATGIPSSGERLLSGKTFLDHPPIFDTFVSSSPVACRVLKWYTHPGDIYGT